MCFVSQDYRRDDSLLEDECLMGFNVDLSLRHCCNAFTNTYLIELI